MAFLGFQPVLCCGMVARARLALAILWGEAKRRAQVFAGMVVGMMETLSSVPCPFTAGIGAAFLSVEGADPMGVDAHVPFPCLPVWQAILEDFVLAGHAPDVIRVR